VKCHLQTKVHSTWRLAVALASLALAAFGRRSAASKQGEEKLVLGAVHSFSEIREYRTENE
jgi:hypothetical protein